MDELTGERVGHRLIDSVAFGPCFGQVMGAEHTVEPGKHGRVVAVAPLAIVGVVPVVKGGRSQKPFERPQTPADVGMDEISPDRPGEENCRRDQAIAEVERIRKP